jgi:nicotinamidase-related amidase/aminoglycoside phosphotransferase (APT) family kinase protein
MPSVLITQCLQRDFVEPIGPHDPLPNKLHVGHAEALRLVGADPQAGPVAQLLRWARAQPHDALELLHVRDWHDPADASQAAHLSAFGSHCVKGTAGAGLVAGLDAGAGPNEAYVDAVGLNDFEEAGLGAHLERIRARAGGEPLRVGVVGVWTEAKVSFLLYDLCTRGRVASLATCSALTASASRAQHFNALEQLRRLLGVEVHDSVAEFAQWLVPSGRPFVSVPPPPVGNRPRLAPPALDLELAETDKDLLALLYRGAAELTLHPLSGGFSGALVFGVEAKDPLGQREAPSVAKLGPRKLVATERAAFERVEAVLGNDAPAVRGFVDLGERAGIKYSYAAMGHGKVRTFKTIYASGAPADRVDALLRTVFDDILGRFSQGAQLERLPLLSHYGFAPRMGPRVRALVSELDPAAGDMVEVGHVRAVHPARLYEEVLPGHVESPSERHWVSYVHGDLNGANILVDARENVWLIDFFHTARSHVLKDLAKLENDLLYILTPLADEEELAQATRMTLALRAVQDLRAPLPEAVEGVRAPALVRAWSALRTLRGLAAARVDSDRDPQQLRIALLRYSVHTLSFDESSPLQKRWALAASAVWAEDVAAELVKSNALRVDWLAGDGPTSRLGLTICPGRKDRGRVLDADLRSLAGAGAGTLVSLVTQAELDWAGIPALADAARAAGLEHLSLAIPDQGVPTMDEARKLVARIDERLERGERVVLHCMGGLGRSGLVAACVEVTRGATAAEAIATVRAARGPRAVETRVQEAFVASFAEVAR